jgi:hypothetical protein
MVPRVQRICVLFDPSLSGERQSEAVGTTATKLGKTWLPIRIGNVDAIPDALERARGERFDGLIFIASPMFTATSEDAVRIGRGATECLVYVGPVRHQPAAIDQHTRLIDRRQSAFEPAA